MGVSVTRRSGASPVHHIFGHVVLGGTSCGSACVLLHPAGAPSVPRVKPSYARVPRAPRSGAANPWRQKVRLCEVMGLANPRFEAFAAALTQIDPRSDPRTPSRPQTDPISAQRRPPMDAGSGPTRRRDLTTTTKGIKSCAAATLQGVRRRMGHGDPFGGGVGGGSMGCGDPRVAAILIAATGCQGRLREHGPRVRDVARKQDLCEPGSPDMHLGQSRSCWHCATRRTPPWHSQTSEHV